MNPLKSSQEIVVVPEAQIAPADAKRRRFLTHGASIAGTLAAGGVVANAAAQEVLPWM